jgi:hypothetical protein
MSEHTSAYAFDHWPIAMNECGEGGFIATRDESVQQSLIAVLVMALRSNDLAQIANSRGQCGSAHSCDSEGDNDFHLLIVADRRDFLKEIYIRLPINAGC